MPSTLIRKSPSRRSPSRRSPSRRSPHKSHRKSARKSHHKKGKFSAPPKYGEQNPHVSPKYGEQKHHGQHHGPMMLKCGQCMKNWQGGQTCGHCGSSDQIGVSKP